MYFEETTNKKCQHSKTKFELCVGDNGKVKNIKETCNIYKGKFGAARKESSNWSLNNLDT